MLTNTIASSEFGTLLSGKSLGADLGFDSLMRKSLLSNLSAEFCVPIGKEVKKLGRKIDL
jgi:hypothetical protein